MNILISGSHGLIGSRLIEVLKAAGHSTIRLVRTRSERPDERVWDAQAASLSPNLLEGSDVLIHLAGESIAGGRWTTRKKQRIYQSRVHSTRVLAETMRTMAKPPQAFIVASAIGYYGDAGEVFLTEESPAGNNFLAGVCRDWEAAADSVRDRMRVVHIRTGMVLSEHGGALESMLMPFKLGIGGVIGSGRQYWSWITLEDIARLFAFAAENDELLGPVNGTTPHPVTCREFTKTLGKRLHRPTIFPLPAGMAKLVLGEMAEELILASTRVLPSVASSNGFQFHNPELSQALDALPL